MAASNVGKAGTPAALSGDYGGILPIPPFDAFMLPVLRHCSEKTWRMRDLVARMTDDLALDDLERDQRTPSGSTTVVASRVHWAKTFLKQAGLVEQPGRALVRITPRGTELLAKNPAKIDTALLLGYDEFRAFSTRTKFGDVSVLAPTLTADVAIAAAIVEPTSTPDEQIAVASKALDEALRDALLARILEGSPAFFEKLIIDLLLSMGYVGSRAVAG